METTKLGPWILFGLHILIIFWIGCEPIEIGRFYTKLHISVFPCKKSEEWAVLNSHHLILPVRQEQFRGNISSGLLYFLLFPKVALILALACFIHFYSLSDNLYCLSFFFSFKVEITQQIFIYLFTVLFQC